MAGTKDRGQKELLKRQVHFPADRFSSKGTPVCLANMGVRYIANLMGLTLLSQPYVDVSGNIPLVKLHYSDLQQCDSKHLSKATIVISFFAQKLAAKETEPLQRQLEVNLSYFRPTSTLEINSCVIKRKFLAYC